MWDPEREVPGADSAVGVPNPELLSGPVLRLGGDVAVARAGRHSRLLEAHLELVHLAVELLGLEAEHILMVQLVGDAAERGRQIVGGRQLEVAAAAFRRELLEARIGPIHPAAMSAAVSAGP